MITFNVGAGIFQRGLEVEHILTELSLPDRYETLSRKLGTNVTNLLVSPHSDTISAIKALAKDVSTRGEGVLIPVYGETGVGKTTFVENLDQWLADSFVPTVNYSGNLTYDLLKEMVEKHSRTLPHNNKKILPINIDHRENDPPSDGELSAIKRFLRTNNSEVSVILFWPETSERIATEVSERYVSISGKTAIDLPLKCKGPAIETWVDIAKHTLLLANGIENLDSLGVSPDDYSPREFPSLGAYLRKISQDFNANILRLQAEMERNISVIVTFVSESTTPGVLSQLTSPGRYGFLEASALISVTSQSVIGKWWASRRGLLTRTIVQLNAHALSLPPTAAASCIRNFTDKMEMFDIIGYRKYGPARGVRDLERSDLGKILADETISRFEARGTPPEDAGAAFDLLSQSGFNLGKDKKLNVVMKDAIEALLKKNERPFVKVTAEKKLDFCSLIPDNAIYRDDEVLCVEYTWRKGDFLATKNRSTSAQYILTKLQGYARELGWVND
ncbi:hypothetical protein [Gluconobacter oxydans]|uniref:hypothetical protein n=1 Tax=Gluconobacter oxydans TaxID=442 RepID=UPI0039ECB72B